MEISKEKLLETVKNLCSIGNRWPGTSGETAAIKYMTDKLAAFSDSVEEQEFEYLHYTPKTASLKLKYPVEKDIKCQSIQYSGNGIAEGELIYVGEGWEDDFKTLAGIGISFNGKIVISNTNRSYVAGKNAAKFGAAGLIVISDSPFNTIRKLSSQMGFNEQTEISSFGCPILGVIVCKKDGEYLLSIVSSIKTSAVIEHASERKIRKSKNIVGTIKGRSKPGDEIIIGAHYDTQEGIEGAWDNASGCSAFLEFCRLFSENRPERTVRFCAFGCEEIGLFGSTNYVNKRKNNLKNITAYINLDSTSSDTSYIRRVLASREVLDLVLKIISENPGWEANQTRSFSELDHEQDSAEFFKNGVRCVWISEEGNPYFHTIYDNLKSINFDKLEKSAKASFLVSSYFANLYKK